MKSNRRVFLLGTMGAAVALSGRSIAAFAQDAEAGALMIHGDMVQGGQNLTDEERPERSCVLNSRFPRNSQIVWRARVIDPETGGQMDDSMLESVEVILSDGQTLEMEYGVHPPAPNPPRDSYWTAAWLVPKDYPTGTLTFSIDATAADGRTGEFLPFDIPSSLPTITEEVLQDVERE